VKPSNESVVAALRQLVAYTQLEDGQSQSFRTRAYEKAIDAIAGQSADVADMTLAELKSIDGVGDSTARKIIEFVANGSIGKVDRLKERFPPTMLDLMKIPGLGPKTVLSLQEHLDVVDVAGLEQAIADERLRDLPGMGLKSEEKIASAIELLGIHSDDTRTPIFEAMRIAHRVMADVERTGEVKRMEYAGSLRRLSETIGDIDILATAKDPDALIAAFTSLGGVTAVLGSGTTKASVVIDDSIQVDLRVVGEDDWGAALMYFTGSKGHNIELRQRALDRGWTLNEYSLSSVEGGVTVASKTEEDIYASLDLPWMSPELREGIGEIAAAANGDLPDVTVVDSIRGDLHVHTDMSGDGKSSLDEMLTEVLARGLEYVAITDHAEDLAMNGLSRERMLEQRVAIEEARRRFPDLLILHGAELNIGSDGSIDYDAEFLQGFDFGVASVHSHFDLDEAAQTQRLVTAIHNPAVNVIGHLSGRRIGSRPGIRFDLGAVLSAAAETGTALEINSSLQRLDMSAASLKAAVEVDGVMFAVSTDAHITTELGNMRWGAALARKGWVPPSRIVNSLTKTEFKAWIALKRNATTL
jgi:DNA polymerase (family 10)